MTTIYYDRNADLNRLAGRTVAIIGYGSQGHAHALNLRDSGVKVVVGLYRDSLSWPKAVAAGLTVTTVHAASRDADITMMLTPDTGQRALFDGEIAPALAAGKTLMFAHGFNVHFGEIVPPSAVDVSLVAPKSPGHRLREVFATGGGVPALVAVQQNASGYALDDALAYAKALGCTRAGVLQTTFAEETETDLFGEQAVLCGGVSALVKAGFETLVEAGYQPEIAYFECLHELKLIVDLMYQGGLGYMRYSVSDTAEFGDYVAGERVIGDASRRAMRDLLAEVRDRTFAKRWIEESRSGREYFFRRRADEADHLIETVGKALRAQMPFVEPREAPVAIGERSALAVSS